MFNEYIPEALLLILQFNNVSLASNEKKNYTGFGEKEELQFSASIQKVKLNLVKDGKLFKKKRPIYQAAVIVKNNTILSIEDRQGTKKMLSKLKKKSEGILIKLPKKKQDLRMDLPTIGLQTLKDCKKYGLKGIVLKSKKNIILDKVKCIQFANKNRIFIKII